MCVGAPPPRPLRPPARQSAEDGSQYYLVECLINKSPAVAKITVKADTGAKASLFLDSFKQWLLAV